ncbi:MAG: PsiF family protein [Burkholderiaceae bacterium]|jgi:hypothetical protein
MRLVVGALALLLLSPVSSVLAADNAQQTRMADCNQQAADKKGDDRKVFMKACLSGKPVEPPKPLTPQERMKQCNKDATGKTGDDRKAFMSDCLKADK